MAPKLESLSLFMAFLISFWRPGGFLVLSLLCLRDLPSDLPVTCSLEALATPNLSSFTGVVAQVSLKHRPCELTRVTTHVGDPSGSGGIGACASQAPREWVPLDIIWNCILVKTILCMIPAPCFLPSCLYFELGPTCTRCYSHSLEARICAWEVRRPSERHQEPSEGQRDETMVNGSVAYWALRGPRKSFPRQHTSANMTHTTQPCQQITCIHN